MDRINTYKKYQEFSKVVTAYHDGEKVLDQALEINSVDWQTKISENARKYIQRFNQLLKKTERASNEEEVIHILINN